MSLATRILLLIALAMVPVVAAQVYTQIELQHRRQSAEREDALRYARLVSSDAARVVEGVKAILIAVSQAPFIQTLELSTCESYLAELAKRYPQILNLTLIDDQGTPLCANTRIAPGATAVDRFYFHEALRLNDFVIGEYIVGRTIRRPQLPLALPFTDKAGRRFVLAAGLNFAWLDEHFDTLALPPGAALWIADRRGNVVVAPSDDSLGKPLPDDLTPARGSYEDTFTRRASNGSTHVVGFQPTGAPPVGLIVIVDLPPTAVSMAANAEASRDLTILGIAIALAAGTAGFGTLQLVSRPLQRLTVAARSWSAGDYHVRARLPDRVSEIGQLGTAFDQMADTIERDQQSLRELNESLEQRVIERTMALSTANRQLEDEMAERQAAEAALRQAQKMEAIGRLTGGIAHDFNNLLTAIGGSIEFLKAAAKEQNERAERYYTLGREAVHRAARMTHRLLAFARQQPLEVQPVDLNRLVADMSDLLMRTLGEDVEVETVLAGGLWPTRSDPVQIENALLNLAINARDAMPDGGRLTIETANASLDSAYAAAHAEVEPGQYVMLAVSDTGSGMSADTASRAFDPFFTTKPAGKGTGLGLSMIYGFSKQSGGHLKIYSELGRGTTIKLYLPRLTAEVDVASARAAPALAAAPARAGEAVLVVEDDAAVREMSTEFLRSLGYAVFDAADAATGLRVLRSRPEISVLFTDVVLSGGMSGRELADLARTERPDLPILFTTGYTPNAIIHGGILDSGVDLLPKPFTAEALGAKLRTVLDRTKTTAKA